MRPARRIISHPNDLDSLSVLPIRRLPGRGRVALAEHLIASPQQREAFEGELNRHLFACGCAAATWGLLIGALGYAVWAVLAAPDIGALGLAGRGFLAAIGGSLIGKLAGLFAAENRLRQTVSDVKRAIPASAVVRPKPLPDGITCY